jgi:hypothetical protein
MKRREQRLNRCILGSLLELEFSLWRQKKTIIMKIRVYIYIYIYTHTRTHTHVYIGTGTGNLKHAVSQTWNLIHSLQTHVLGKIEQLLRREMSIWHRQRKLESRSDRYVCVYVYIYIYIYIYAYIYIYTYVCMYVCMATFRLTF